MVVGDVERPLFSPRSLRVDLDPPVNGCFSLRSQCPWFRQLVVAAIVPRGMVSAALRLSRKRACEWERSA